MLLDNALMLQQVILIQLKNQLVILHFLPIHVFLIFHVFYVYYSLYQLIMLLMHHMMVLFLLQFHLENVVCHLFYFILFYAKRNTNNTTQNPKTLSIMNVENVFQNETQTTNTHTSTHTHNRCTKEHTCY